MVRLDVIQMTGSGEAQASVALEFAPAFPQREKDKEKNSNTQNLKQH